MKHLAYKLLSKGFKCILIGYSLMRVLKFRILVALLQTAKVIVKTVKFATLWAIGAI